MSLDTYTSLKAAVATQLARTDLTAQIVDAITLTEAKVQRILRDRNMEQRATAPISEYLPFPTDFLEIRDIQLNTSDGKKTLEMMAPAQLNSIDFSRGGTTGRPRAYCLIANQIQFGPSPDQGYTVEIVHYKKVPVLSASNAVNWLLTDHPDVYLYGACFEACAMSRDTEGAQGYKMLYQGAIQDLTNMERQQRFSGTPLTMRPG